MAAPSPQQTQAINDAMSDLGIISKPLLTNHIKQLPNLLQNQELPEKLLAVTQGANDSLPACGYQPQNYDDMGGHVLFLRESEGT